VEYEIINESKQHDFSQYDESVEKQFKIISVSRIEYAKGADDLIGLASILINSIDFKINLYGTGSYWEEFFEKVGKSNLEDHITYKRWLDRKHLLATINEIHVAVFSLLVEGCCNRLFKIFKINL
jgi:glycosyltransferase involved in cell wall biosynthesis